MFKNTFITLILFFLMVNVAIAQLNVVATNPDLASIAKEIGKEKVKISTLGKGYQDPHFVDPKPSFVLKLNKADLLLLNGMEQEIGWLPVLITGARNSKISRVDSPGYVDCSKFIKNKLEIPKEIDRTMGDVHGEGNPHYMLDPRNGISVARGISEKLVELDPENKLFYKQNFFKFKTTLEKKISGWEFALKRYKGLNVVTYHKLWPYFFNWTGFKLLETIEPVPGVPPSPDHIANLIKKAGEVENKVIISSNFYPQKTGKIIAKKINSPFISLPVMVEGEKEVTSYVVLFDYIINQITSVL